MRAALLFITLAGPALAQGTDHVAEACSPASRR
jgi:hypothetical protein